jgi:hypothetical protein
MLGTKLASLGQQVPEMRLEVCFCRILLVFIFLLPLAACSATSQPGEPAGVDLSGVWRGELRVIPCSPGVPAEMGRCNAVNRIAFSLRQSDSTLSGEYRCAIGTMVCRDANTTDHGTVVSGQVSGRNLTMRVILPGDVSSCLFNGSDSSTDIRGGYRCYQGGGLAEVGTWQVRRGADESHPPPWRPE